MQQLPLPAPKDPTYVFQHSEFPPLDWFEEREILPALSVPVNLTGPLRKELKNRLWSRPRRKNVYPDPDDTTKRILLLQPAATNLAERTHGITLQDDVFNDERIKKLLNSNSDIRQTTFEVIESYQEMPTERILRKLLPFAEVPSAFETIGTIAHLNLREEQIAYKYLIGRILLDKLQPRIATIVNKTGMINTVYRTFGMEVIAGSEAPGWSEVVVKEEGCEFQLDFQEVYWNSRLCGEHRRLVEELRRACVATKKGSCVIADLMAGVGPFCVPLTANNNKKKENKHVDFLKVYANDLNPVSFKYLELNAKANKCRNLFCFNMDARTFCRHLQRENIDADHVIMNLPASAPEFLDAFRGWKSSKLPLLHVYCFGPKDLTTASAEAIQRCSEALGVRLNKDEADVRIVRDVSPGKNMLCISFELPEAVRGLEPVDLCVQSADLSEPPEAKKARTS